MFFWKTFIFTAILEIIFGFAATECYRDFRKKGKPYTISILLAIFTHICYTFFFVGIGAKVINSKDKYTGWICGGVSFAVLMIVYLICFAICDRIHDKIRNEEMGLLPNRLQNYISQYGYTSIDDFMTYCKTAPEFIRSRKIKFINPDHKENQKANEFVKFYDYIMYIYKEKVYEDTKEHLRNIIPNIFMFDFETLYELSSEFHDFYDNIGGRGRRFIFLAIDPVNECFSKKIIRLKFPKDGIYASTLSQEKFAETTGCECNIEEGETIELSLDD